MKSGVSPLVIGNWKMNPQSASASVKLVTEIKKNSTKITDVDIVIAPPFVFLESVYRTRGSRKDLMLGAQNVSHEKLGAHTGDISLSMLRGFSVTHVILGHSERRSAGESDDVINKKVYETVKEGMTAVVCVGESERDQSAHYLSFVETQIRRAFHNISKTKLGHMVIAYEPIWAIGTGKNATADDVHEMKLFIEKVIADLYGRNYAKKVRILYGGSVKGKNARELFERGMIDGFLVGGASVRSDEFIQIAKSVRKV